jgi:hypothetical protein
MTTPPAHERVLTRCPIFADDAVLEDVDTDEDLNTDLVKSPISLVHESGASWKYQIDRLTRGRYYDHNFLRFLPIFRRKYCLFSQKPML